MLIFTAANRGKVECGRTTFLTDTAANEKRQSCGRTNFSFIRPQIGRRRNAAVPPNSPIRPQMKKDRAAAVRIAHLDGRKKGKGGMRPYDLLRQYGRNWKKTELRPYVATAAVKSRFCVPGRRRLSAGHRITLAHKVEKLRFVCQPGSASRIFREEK